MLRRSALVCAIICVLPALPVRAADEKVDIAGHYAVEGTNPGGGTYKGKAEITKKGETYEIAWIIGAAEAYQGIGILQGDLLAVSYASANITGVVMYRVEKGPKLVGRWAIQGKDGRVHTETLTRTEAPKPGSVSADPGTLGAFRQSVGKSFYFEVTGTNTGSVWGTDIYTDDSRLSTAAVHAGLLKLGQKGVVKVTMLRGQQSYQGSQRNGVYTSSWGQWGGCYRIEADDRKEVSAPR